MFESILSYRAGITPERLAMMTPDGDVSYATLHAGVLGGATLLREAGFKPREVVLVSDTRPFGHWVTLMALELLGCVSVSDDARGMARQAVNYDRHVSEAPVDESSVPVLTTDRGWLMGLFGAPRSIERVSTDPHDVVRIVLTSGSTGLPKALPIERRVLDAQISHLLSNPLPSEPRLLSTMGIDAMGGFLGTLATWMSGGTMIYVKGSETATALATLKPNFLVMAPIQLQHLLAALPADHKPIPGLRVGVGGSALPRRLRDQVKARLADTIVTAYGATECGFVATGTGDELLTQPGAVGYVLPWALLEIVDDSERCVPAGTIGRVRMRTEAMPTDYLDGSARGDGAYKDGWFYPGDLGWLREDGLFVLEGRADDVLNLGGVKLSAWSVEEKALEHPGIVEAAAFSLPVDGVPHLHVAVVLAPGADVASIADHMGRGMTVATRLVTLAKLPRNLMGKVMRKELREAVAAMA